MFVNPPPMLHTTKSSFNTWRLISRYINAVAAVAGTAGAAVEQLISHSLIPDAGEPAMSPGSDRCSAPPIHPLFRPGTRLINPLPKCSITVSHLNSNPIFDPAVKPEFRTILVDKLI